MRKLVWFALGMCLCCGLWARELLPEQMTATVPWLLAAALVLMLAAKKLPRTMAAAFVLLGIAGAAVCCRSFETRVLLPLEPLDGKTLRARILSLEEPRQTGYGWCLEGEMRLEGSTCGVRVYMDEELPVQPGTWMEGDFRFRVNRTGSGEKGAADAGSGLFLQATQRGELTLSQEQEPGFSLKMARVRSRILQALEESLPEEKVPFARSLLLGDTSRLDYETDTVLKTSGIRHVAAVSGLHVSIVFALLGMVTGKNRYLMPLLGFAVLPVLCALAGFTPSVTRSCLMSALMLLSVLLNRVYDGPSALAFSLVVMLGANPAAVGSVGLQLSAASVAGILLFCQRLREYLDKVLPVPVRNPWGWKLRRSLILTVSVSVSAMSLTVPLCAWYFGTVSLISLVTNIAVLWLVSLSFYGLMALCLVYFFSPGGALILGKAVGWIMGCVLTVSRWMASFPLACVYTESVYIRFWLVFVYVLLMLLLPARKKRPGIFLALATGGLCLALVCSWAEPMLWDTSVTVLDVGQGQSILLQHRGSTYLVDCGGRSDAQAADAAARELLSRGITRLDGIILTHWDRDHSGGIGYLLSRMKTDLLILPPGREDPGWDAKHTVWVDRTVELALSGGTLRIFGENTRSSDNENSLCILFDTEKCDILITGDRNSKGEERLMAMGYPLKADVLIVGHHGAGDATSAGLLRTVQPQIACISVEKDNRYGHPDPQVLRRLTDAGCSIFRTDLHGTITIRR